MAAFAERAALGSRLVSKVSGEWPPPADPLAELDRIPKSIPASKVRAFLRELGLELTDVSVEEGDGIRVGWPCITATIFATNADGRPYFDMATQTVAKHQISIPIIEDEGH